MMRALVAGGLLALALTLAAGAAEAQDDDWEFQQDPAQGLSVAAVRYDSGAMIVVQCKAGALTAVIAGLPVTADALKLEAARADGRRDVQDWSSAGAPGAFRSETTARDVRFLRGGGSYAIHTAAGTTPALTATLDLPGRSANLDTVLTACGWSLADERDQIARADDAISLVDPAKADDGPRVRRRSSSRDISGERRRGSRPAPPAPGLPAAERQVSCIVRSLHLTDCRPDHPGTDGASADPRVLASLEGREVFAAPNADVEGRVVYLSGGAYRVVDYIATVPAR